MKKIFFFIVMASMLLSACQQKVESDADRMLTVAVAANAQFAMEALKAGFARVSDAEVELVVGSSGKLAAQILQGAPFDVFVSADMVYPDTLFRAGMATSEPMLYAYGTLVMWTFKDIDLSTGVRVLQQDDVQKIAIANPRTAPYGAETMRMFSNYRVYDEKLLKKLVYGESIAQTNQYIVSGSCDIGITAKSVVMAPEMQGKGTWVEIDPVGYQPIAQGVVITKHGLEKHPKSSKAFTDLLLGAEGQKILKAYGYQLPNEPVKGNEF